jgi:endonuclease YncB( thermonuclease family)
MRSFNNIFLVMRRVSIGFIFAAFLLGSGLSALGAERPGVLAGPIPARVLQVVDGDTVRVRARIWLDQELTTLVRLAGVDAPETKARCEEERVLAARAHALLETLAADGVVVLADVTLGKYAGRVVARVSSPGGKDWAAALLAAGLARPYDGGAREGWCAGSAIPVRPR